MKHLWIVLFCLFSYPAWAAEVIVFGSAEPAQMRAVKEPDTFFVWSQQTMGATVIRFRNDKDDKPGCATVLSMGVRYADHALLPEAFEYCQVDSRWQLQRLLDSGMSLMSRLPEDFARKLVLALPMSGLSAGSRFSLDIDRPVWDRIGASYMALVEPTKNHLWLNGDDIGGIRIVGQAQDPENGFCLAMAGYETRARAGYSTTIRACQLETSRAITFHAGDRSPAQGYPPAAQVNNIVQSLAKLAGSQTAVASNMPTAQALATVAPTQGATGVAQPSVAPVTAPTAVPANTGKAFGGFRLDQLDELARLRDPRFPWIDGPHATQGPLDPAKLAGHQAAVGQAMARMQTLYGTLTPQQMKEFSALWAPFFDFPSTASQAYFSQLNPALDDYIAAAAAVEELAPAYRDGLVNLATAAAVGNDQATAAALKTTNAQATTLEQAQQKMLRSASHIKHLGNPPNPLAARSAAREQHRRAVGGDDAIWRLLRQTNFVAAVDHEGGAGDFVLMQNIFRPKTELRWDGLRFQYRSIDPLFDTPCREIAKGQWHSQDKTELTGRLSADGRYLLDVSGVGVQRSCTDTKSGVFKEKQKTIQLRQLQAQLYQNQPIEAGASKIWLAFTNHAGPVNMKDPKLAAGEVLVAFRNYLDVRPLKINISKLAEYAGSLTAAVGGVGGSTAKDPWGINSKPPSEANKPDAEAQNSPSVIFGQAATGNVASGTDNTALADAAREAIAQHLLLAKSRDESAARWAAEAAKERDAKRRDEFESRAAWEKDMAQAERDLAKGIDTGIIVRTRTAWDDKQQQKLIAGIKTELAEFDKDKPRLELIPKLAGLVEGADGVRIREEVQKRIQEAIRAPDRGAQLDQLQLQLRKVVASQREIELAKHAERVGEWDARITAAEGIKQGADTALLAASFLVPGSGAVSMAYGLGTGYAEGGVTQAVENSARAYSEKIDVAVAVVRGGLERDETTGERAGAGGAVWAGISTHVRNKLMGAVTSKTTGVIQGGINKATAKPTATPTPPIRPEAFQDNHERYREALKTAKTPEQRQTVQQRFRVIVARESMRSELQAVTERHEKLIPAAARNSDGSINTQHPAYRQVRAAWESDMAAARQKFLGDENRMALHREALAEGFLHSDDIPLSGGQPKSIMSDMDVSPRNYAAGKKYVQALQKSGLEVLDYPDRWIVPGTDMTVWKPGHGADKPGSTSFELATIYDSLPGSDKFPTRGGVEYTLQQGQTGELIPLPGWARDLAKQGQTGDPRGAVIANLKKAVEAGIGGRASQADLHVVGKSVDKAIQISGIKVDAKLAKMNQKRREHQTDDESEITTFGATAEVKARERADYLRQNQKTLVDAYEAASVKSAQSEAILRSDLAAAQVRGDQAAAQNIRETLMAYKISNDMALQTIAKSDPATVGLIFTRQTLPPPSQANTGYLLNQLMQSREQPPPMPPVSIAMPGVGERCKTATAAVVEKLRLTKAGSPEALYLDRLQKALERGSRDPSQAVTEVRLLSGMELSHVLQQLAPASTGVR